MDCVSDIVFGKVFNESIGEIVVTLSVEVGIILNQQILYGERLGRSKRTPWSIIHFVS